MPHERQPMALLAAKPHWLLPAEKFAYQELPKERAIRSGRSESVSFVTERRLATSPPGAGNVGDSKQSRRANYLETFTLARNW